MFKIMTKKYNIIYQNDEKVVQTVVIIKLFQNNFLNIQLILISFNLNTIFKHI